MLQKFRGLIPAILLSLSAAAQDLDVDISSDGISVDTETWYESPIVWVAFALILVVALVVGLRRGKSA